MLSGDVVVLATPRIVALCEQAAVASIAEQLEEGTTTVGTEFSIQHSAPTPVGGTVTATARLLKVSGRRLKFSVTVEDAHGSVATGEHVRVIVNRDRFDAAASERS